MRLITRTVHRAFPELDAFDDDACRRFVRSAEGGPTASAPRVLATALVGGVLSGASIGLVWRMGRLHGRGRADDLPVLVQSGLALIVLLLLSWAIALLTRDVLLRLGIRRILANSARCGRCGYSLLGVPAARSSGEVGGVSGGPDALHITCPECGGLTTADPALGELVSDGGTAVYRPIVRPTDPKVEQRRRSSGRRQRRRTAAAAAAIVFIAIIGYGLLWLQALHACRAPQPGPAIAALRTSLRDTRGGAGPVSDEEAGRRWSRLMRIVESAQEIAQGREPGAPAPQSPSRLVPQVLDSGATDPALAAFGVNTWAERAAAQSVALRVWQIARDRGLLAELRGLPGLVGASQPVPTAATALAAWNQTRDLHAAHEILQVDLEMARRAGDRRAYVEAVASMRALQLIVAQQGEDEFPMASGLYAALRSHLPRIPDRDWLAEVVDAAGEAPGVDPYLPGRRELARIHGRTLIGLVFSRPHTPLKRLLGLDAGFSRAIVGVGVGSPLQSVRWIGTYQGNLAALETAVGSLAQPPRPPLVRPPSPSDPFPPFPLMGPPVADMVLQSQHATFHWRLKMRGVAHRQWLEMKVELFKRERGRLPASWAEVLGPDGWERLVIDATTGLPLIIRPSGSEPSDNGPLGFGVEVQADPTLAP